MSSQRRNTRLSGAWLLVCVATACGGSVSTGHGNPGGHAGLGGAPGVAGAASVGGTANQAGSAGNEAQCTTDSQCPHSALCLQCPDGSAACAWAKCESGACVGGIAPCAAGGPSGSGGSDGGSGGSGGSGGKECLVTPDCSHDHLGVCKNCADGTQVCSTLDCVDGQCLTYIAPCPLGAAGVSGMAGSGG